MSQDLPPIPRPLRILTTLMSAAVLVSGVLVAALAVGAPLVSVDQRPSWALFGFEVVVVVAGALGVLTGRGRFADGPGLALACVGGCVLVASGLGWAGAGKSLLGVSLLPLLGARVVASGVLGAIAAWCVLSRDARAFRPAVIGVLLVFPVIAAAGLGAMPVGRKLLDRFAAAGPGLQFAGAVGAFAVTAILLSAGIHLLIRAFEMGRPTSPRA